MFMAMVMVAGGLALLVAGGELMLRGAVGLATLWRLTPAVIGLTVVAAGTSVPELAVSISAAWQDKTDIAVGNVIGSNIFNIGFVLGLSALMLPLAIGGQTIKLEYPVLALVTLMCLAVAQDGVINWLDATLFVAVYVGFTLYLVSLVREHATPAEEEQFRAETRELAADRPPQLGICLLLIVVGVALLSGGAHFTVEGASTIGRYYGMTDRLIGLTIVAIGTGLPELVTSVVSAVRGRDDVAIGNIIGSNMFNILAILGLSALLAPLPVPEAMSNRDNWWMMGITVLLFPLMYSGLRIERWEGVVLLSAYGAYMATLILIP